MKEAKSIPSLTELEELRSRATQGEWTHFPEEHTKDGDSSYAEITVVGEKDEFACRLADWLIDEDAAYIVALHNAFPSLKARIEELERKAEAGEKLAEMVENIDEVMVRRFPLNDSFQERAVVNDYWREKRNEALAAYRSATQDDSKE